MSTESLDTPSRFFIQLIDPCRTSESLLSDKKNAYCGLEFEKVGIIARAFCDCDIYTIQFALLSMKFLGRRTVKKTLLFPASPATTHGSTVDLIPSADCTIVGNRQLAPAFL